MRKIKYIVSLIILITILSISTTVIAMDNSTLDSQMDDLNISDFLEESKKYTDNVFGDLDVKELFESAITGNIDNNSIYKNVLKILGKEVVSSVKVLGSILVIIVVHSILKSITDSLQAGTVSQIIYYVQYILIVSLIMTSFANTIEMFNETIQSLTGFSNTLIPLLITLMLTTGNFVSAGLVEPILLFLITFIGNVISTFILPLLFIGVSLGVISNISEKVQIDKLSKYFKSSIAWGLGILLTIFVAVLSIQGSITSTIDGVTAKTAKAAVSSLIPVVGKILGDAVDTVLSCANILKNAVGIIGVIVVISICVLPIIKIAILTIVYYLSSAIAEPIADKKIVKLLEQMGGAFKILLAIICSISVMLIIGITLVIKMTNSGLMYR